VTITADIAAVPTTPPDPVRGVIDGIRAPGLRRVTGKLPSTIHPT
jgi:hypothetical protein